MLITSELACNMWEAEIKHHDKLLTSNTQSEKYFKCSSIKLNSFDFENAAGQNCTKGLLQFSNHYQSLSGNHDLLKYKQIQNYIEVHTCIEKAQQNECTYLSLVKTCKV